MNRPQPISTRSDTLFPYATLFRSDRLRSGLGGIAGKEQRLAAARIIVGVFGEEDRAPAREADHRLGPAIGRPGRPRQARARFDAPQGRVEPPDLVEALERHPAFAARGIERHRFDVALRIAL